MWRYTRVLGLAATASVGAGPGTRAKVAAELEALKVSSPAPASVMRRRQQPEHGRRVVAAHGRLVDFHMDCIASAAAAAAVCSRSSSTRRLSPCASGYFYTDCQVFHKSVLKYFAGNIVSVSHSTCPIKAIATERRS